MQDGVQAVRAAAARAAVIPAPPAPTTTTSTSAGRSMAAGARSWRKTVTGSRIAGHAPRRRTTPGPAEHDLCVTPSATARPIPPLRETWPDIDVVDAYEIQLLNIRRRLDAGATVHGPQGRAVVAGDAGDDGRRRARLRPPAVRHGARRGPAGAAPAATASRGSRSRSASCSATTCPARAAPSADVLRRDRVRRAGDRADRQPDRRLGHQDRRHHRRQRLLGRASCSARTGSSPTEIDLLHHRRPPAAQRRAGRARAVPTRSSATRPSRSPGWPDKVASFGVPLEAGHVILPGSVHRAIDVSPGDDFVAASPGSAPSA